MQEHEKPWKPLTIEEVSFLFTGASFPWWIAGGIALELAVGETIRSHSDIDVLVLRRDHHTLREHFSEWDCWVADPPGRLRVWQMGEELAMGVHDIWCRESANDAWRLQVMLDESDAGGWVSRRDSRVRASMEEVTRRTSNGIRYIAPHIQLFYKAKVPREKDEIDFHAVIDRGIDFDAIWLRRAIIYCYGENHPWLKHLPC